MKVMFGMKPVICSVNPLCGRSGSQAIQSPKGKEKGNCCRRRPGGMTAALFAGRQGHDVTLYEKGDALGAGQLRLATNLPGKKDMKHIEQYHTAMFKEYGNIKVVFNTEVDADLVKSEKPDAVIVATGAKDVKPNLPGVDNKYKIRL